MGTKLATSAETEKNVLSRRRLFGLAGVTMAVVAVDTIGSSRTTAEALASTSSCKTTSAGEEGPFFVEERLLRSDIRSNSDGTSTQAGVPVRFPITVRDDDCGTALSGAHVDIWQANAQGVYSDEASESTSGENYLRGYQITDSAGQASFTTIYPGWYSGRTDHIHVRVRTYSGDTVTYDFESQIMFDDAITDEVLDTAAYQRSRSRDTTNSTDRVYAAEEGEHGVLTFDTFAGDTPNGFTGSVTMVIGTVANGTTAVSTTTVSALTVAVSSYTVTAISGRRHRVSTTLTTSEDVRLDARLYRSGRLLRRTVSTVAEGRHRLSLTTPMGTTGRVTVALYLTGASGTKKLTRTVEV